MGPVATAFWRTAVRPKWIAALVLVLAVAGAFAALAQWQIGRSVENAIIAGADTETPVPLTELAEPRTGVTEAQAGRVVTVTGRLDPDAYVVLTGRDGGRAWLVGRLITTEGVSLAVALGVAPDAAAAAAAAPADPGERAWTGRYLPSEPPQESDFEAGERNALSVAELVNLWPADPDPAVAYGGYLVAADPPPGLEAIVAGPPPTDLQFNLLNLFYAVEWVIFGGFAFYLWYRLVRDEVERELETGAAGGGGEPDGAGPRNVD